MSTTTHLVSHALREIESALRDVLEPIEDRSARLSKDSDKQVSEIQAFLKALQIDHSHPIAQSWLGMAGKKNEIALHRRAHRRDLEEPRRLDAEFRSFWNDCQALLDTVLDRFETRYSAVSRQLDDLIARDTPTTLDAKTIHLNVPHSFVALNYFFQRISNPAWLALLRGEGFFKHPPAPQLDESEGVISFTHWPESAFLARMAGSISADVQRIVLAIMLDIPASDNIFVHMDLLKAALALTPGMAGEWARTEVEWLAGQRWLAVPGDNYGKLISHLARGGEVTTALAMLKELLTVFREERPAEEPTDVEEPVLLRPPPRPQSKLQSAVYREILLEHVPDVALAAPENTFKLLCDVLEDAVEFSMWPEMTQNPGEDYSGVWRPAIEDHSQNHSHDIRDFLVTAARDTAETWIARDSSMLRQIVVGLESREWLTFQRLALHLLRRFPDAAPDLLLARLLDRGQLDEGEHEYFVLLRERFLQLSGEDRATILEAIKAGPSYESSNADYWRYRRLLAIEGGLPDEERLRLGQLRHRFGELEYPDLESPIISGRSVPQSPTTAVQLAAMNIDQLIEHLTTWNPPNTLLGPSPEGLGRELTAAVKAAPPRWALHAAKFKWLHPTYVRHFLDGFFEIAVIGAGVGQDAVLDWAPVLDLCRWAAPATAPTGTSPRHPLDLDRDWQGTHLTIARLVYECCGSGGIGVPIELRETVWEAIEPLMSSPDPSLERESQFLQQESADAVLLAMNSVRGEALHAVFRYADWVRKRQIPCSGRDDTFGIDNLPEVKAVLELRLKPDIEPSLAVRSVYGQWLPLLFAIDNAWLAAQVQAVFPQTPESVDLRQAAWEGFVTTCPPSRELYELLKPEYERAINRLGIDVPGRRGMREPNKWLAQHLIWLYAVGVIELNDDSPLTTFFALAPDELRAMAMDFVADTSRPPDNYPPFTARLMALWEHRLAIAAKAKSTVDFTKELAAFGSSFASRVFDDAWALDQLEAVLTLVGNVEPDHLVVERLAELSDLRLSETLRTLELLIMGVTEEWRIYGWQQAAMTVLQNGLKATDPTVKTAATQLINRLVSRGHQEFLTLLS